jgi:UTP:GlnB (protein PII) uridylyltransferase
MQEIERRRVFTIERTAELVSKLPDGEGILADRASVYATGSFGRLEASEYSDLDVFIVGRSLQAPAGKISTQSQLPMLDEICVKADLIEAIRAMGLPDLDGDGRYLIHRSAGEFVSALGTPEDDANNTFTARLLMLLESRPLLGRGAYESAIDSVVAAYWRDYKSHKTEFVPAYLANDILRLWRTFCVNYEARTQREPEDKKAKGKLKNYKLRHSRLLTCYSTLLMLLAIFRKSGTVTPGDVVGMTRLTPIERLQSLQSEASLSEARPIIDRLLRQYNSYLEKTHEPEAMMVLKFADKSKRKEFIDDASLFGNLMYDALMTVGGGSLLHRMLVV